MSGEYAGLLKRRAEAMHVLARRLLEEGMYDLAALNAEYSAQLYIKSLLYRLTGEEWRGHWLRSLLGVLITVLQEHGYREEAEALLDYVRSRRRLLAELEEAHTRAVYGPMEYSRDQARLLVEVAGEVIRLLKRVEEEVLPGV